jgi:hypothetical protein
MCYGFKINFRPYNRILQKPASINIFVIVQPFEKDFDRITGYTRFYLKCINKVDGVVKSPNLVTPAQAGVQCF